jgi:hypothetical protein
MLYVSIYKAKTANAGIAAQTAALTLSRGAAAPVYRPPAADVVFVELPGEGETVAVVGTATRDVLEDETTAEEEDLSVDGMPGWTVVLVLGLLFPGKTPPGAGETEVEEGLDPGTPVAVPGPVPVPVPGAGAGTGITVSVGAVPGSVTVYTTVPVTTVSVAV